MFQEKSNPLKYSDGFDWTEDFDGIQEKYGKTLYYNLKMRRLLNILFAFAATTIA